MFLVSRVTAAGGIRAVPRPSLKPNIRGVIMRLSSRFAFGAVAVLLALPLAAQTTVTVYPADEDGWAQNSAHCAGGTSTGSQQFELGPAVPPMGTGSREFRIGADGNSFEEYRQGGYDGTRLDALTELSYWTYVESNVDRQAVYIILNVDQNGDGTVDDLLFFEPVYQSGNPSLPEQGAVVLNTWQNWDALAGGWWSLNSGCGLTPGAPATLATYLTCFPNAVIENGTSGLGGVRLATGCGGASWVGFVGNADAFTIGVSGTSVTYDFEAVAPAGAGPDITGTKEVAGNFNQGGTVTYTVVLTNVGDATQFDNLGNEFTDVLPAGVELVSASATSGTVNADTTTNTVTWNGQIDAGDSVTITFTATVVGSPGSTVFNQGEIFFDATGDRINDTVRLTDDPTAPGQDDPTDFQIGNVAGIPTLSEMALFVFAGLLALVGFGVTALRR